MAEKKKKPPVTIQALANELLPFAASDDSFTYATLRESFDAYPGMPRTRQFRAAWETLRSRNVIAELETGRKRHQLYRVVNKTLLAKLAGAEPETLDEAAVVASLARRDDTAVLHSSKSVKYGGSHPAIVVQMERIERALEDLNREVSKLAKMMGER